MSAPSALRGLGLRPPRVPPREDLGRRTVAVGSAGGARLRPLGLGLGRALWFAAAMLGWVPGVVVGGLVGSGCGGDPSNEIEGSLTASYDMDFDEVRIRRFSTEISIEYLRNPGPGEEIPMKLSVSFVENDITVGTAYDLHPPSGNAQRITTDNAELPELCPQEERPSTLEFSDYHETDGETIQGKWRLCFANGLDGVGKFKGDLHVIE